MTRRAHHCDFFSKGEVKPLCLENKTSIAGLVEQYGSSEAYNAGRLFEACKVFEKMLKDNAAVTVTLAGAMIPAGMGGLLIQLMERGFIDAIYSTGANLYHDMHFALDLPVYKGDFRAPDEELYKQGIERIYDIFITDDLLRATDKYVQDTFLKYNPKKALSTADLHNILGKSLQESKHPELSVLASAYKHGVPVYCPSPGDSSIGLDLAGLMIKNVDVRLDPILDVLETTALVWASEKNGAIEIGGGAPKNFFMQTQPMLWQILDIQKGGHDYFIQITTDGPQWGGLSGATPSEAISWGKVKAEDKNHAVVYCDATIALPILAGYAIERIQPKPLKRLFDKKDKLLSQLKSEFAKKSAKPS